MSIQHVPVIHLPDLPASDVTVNSSPSHNDTFTVCDWRRSESSRRTIQWLNSSCDSDEYQWLTRLIACSLIHVPISYSSQHQQLIVRLALAVYQPNIPIILTNLLALQPVTSPLWTRHTTSRNIPLTRSTMSSSSGLTDYHSQSAQRPVDNVSLQILNIQYKTNMTVYEYPQI